MKIEIKIKVGEDEIQQFKNDYKNDYDDIENLTSEEVLDRIYQDFCEDYTWYCKHAEISLEVI